MEVEAEEAVKANPGELQAGVENNHCGTADLKRTPRSTSLYRFLQDIQQLLIIPSRIRRKLIRGISLKLGEYAQNVRKTIQDENPHVFAIQGRNKERPLALPRPFCPTQVGKVATTAEHKNKRQYQVDLAAYETKVERVKLDQTTLDMQYKTFFADHEKRKAAYVRNVTRAYDLLMLHYCINVMKERHETQPDYDSTIRNKSGIKQ